MFSAPSPGIGAATVTVSGVRYILSGTLCSGVASAISHRRVTRGERVRVVLEFAQAVGRAEVVRLPAVLALRGRIGRIDLHSAHDVDLHGDAVAASVMPAAPFASGVRRARARRAGAPPRPRAASRS